MRFWVCQRKSTPESDYEQTPPNLKAPWGSPKQKTNNQHLKCRNGQHHGANSPCSHSSDGSVETCRN